MLHTKNPHTKKKARPVDMPTAVWTGHDLLNGKPVETLTIIFCTTGCYWGMGEGCTMCGYVNDSADSIPSDEDLLAQFTRAAGKSTPQTSLIKIFTSGSFFDEGEVTSLARRRILDAIGGMGSVKKVVAETRPEFVTETRLRDTLAVLERYDISFEIAMGLETSNDTIRKECINKGFTFAEFVRASQTAAEMGVSTKAYLLLKPPFLSESMAVDDMLSSISDTVPYASTISLNLCNVQNGTLVEELHNHKDYRPPWLWSAVSILKKAKEMYPHITFMSDPVAAGSKRGPHNCGDCDKEVAQVLRDFSLSQDVNILSDVDCHCYSLWEKVIELEDYTYGSFLVK
ncbi:MAG: archaeosine biosynthesis radical SAM protein RaSEA [Methanosarcinales archaeon]|nr:archaeosine biosynthesis radical SAM protein RaSEA [Methanosarcinales archaeon]